jgi:intracellular septation protein
MKQFVDLLPIALFVAVFFFFTDKDIYVSTAVLMLAVSFQVAFSYFKFKQVDKQTQVVFWVVMLFGGATLLFRNEIFIQWKPTIVNWLFAVALLTSQFIGDRNLIEKMLGSQLELPPIVWRNLSSGWVFGFFLAGALNLLVAYNFSLELWVTYKLVGGFCLTALYIIVTIVYLILGGYLKEPEVEESATPSDS